MSIGVTGEAKRAQREPPPVTGCREDAGMLQDLAALTPPLVVGLAFLIGRVLLLRSQMSSKRRVGPKARRRIRGGKP